MSFSEHQDEPITTKQKGIIRMRSIMDWGMGLMWVGMGVFFIFIKKFNPDLALRYDDAVIKTFGGICILYGCFRMYRGYKKNYLRER